MSTEKIIEESILKAKDAGLVIVRGPVYYIEKKEIIGVDCFGAVMWAHGHGDAQLGDINLDGEKKLWIYTLMKILEKDRSWWSRFHYGFHQKRQLIIETQDANGTKKQSLCKISKSSWELSDKVESVDIHEYIIASKKILT